MESRYEKSMFSYRGKERYWFYLKNDPYIKLIDLQDFEKSIDAKEIVYDNAGHFNTSAGFTKFEDVLKFL